MKDKVEFECFNAKWKVKEIRIIKMANFVEEKFKYLTHLEKFGWMSYLTTQYPVHENLFWVFFSNAALKDVGEEAEG